MAKSRTKRKPAVEKPGLILINADAGTVKTMGEEKIRALVETAIAAHGLAFELKIVAGGEIDGAVRDAMNANVPAIAVGGGDGTISGIARKLAGTDIALGVLPLGTMNLFAKAAGAPEKLEDALAALATMEPVPIDLGEVNGRLFLRQIAFGFQPKMVRLREKLGYSSRFTKIAAGARAFVAVFRRARPLSVEAEIDGVKRVLKGPALVVSNNLYGAAAFQERLDGGVLGLYVLKTAEILPALAVARDIVMGGVGTNPHVLAGEASEIAIRSLKSGWRKRRRAIVSIDGELENVDLPIKIALSPKILRLLMTKRQESDA
jgi:diacylglycerol kinase family enzyme